MSIDRELLRASLQGVLAPETEDDALDAITRVLQDPEIVQELSASAAVVAFGKFRYRVSLRKLCAGLASAALPFLKPENTSIIIGLSLIAALGVLDGIVRKLSADEAAVCQALHEHASKSKGSAELSMPTLRERVSALTESAEDLDRRVEAAVSKLEGMGVVEKRPSQAVALCELVLVRRRPST